MGDEHRPPLVFVLAATGGLVGVPLLAAATLLLALRPRPELAVVAGVSLGIALASAVVAQAIWARRPESERFTLGDLMVWNALRRASAERRVAQQTHMLGFDLEGRYAGHERVPLDQQLAIAREISHALEVKSAYSRNHSRRVERHVRRMAAMMGLSHEDTEQLAIAAELHDIGNIQIPDHLLSKPGVLTQLEREAIEGHVSMGAAMAFTAGSPEVVEAIRHHHEHWDGSGYPSGLAGDEIPLFARMIAIAEVYDAMTSPRPYRRAFTRDQALQMIRDQAGIQFDPDLVDVFNDAVREPAAAAFAPLLVFPLRLAGDFFASVRRMGNGSVAAFVGGATSLVLLGTAIVAPGTFDLPSEFSPPEANAPASAPVTVSVEAPAPPDERERVTHRDGRVDGTLADAGDIVLGTRFHNGSSAGPAPAPPAPPATDPTDPTPTPPGAPTPDPGAPTPDPGIGGPAPDPGVDLPDDVRGKGKKKAKPVKGLKDKNPASPGNGHAYGHDKKEGARGQGKDKNPSAPGNGHAHGNDKDDKKKEGPAAPPVGVAMTPTEPDSDDSPGATDD